jgi:hypothetical protein
MPCAALPILQPQTIAQPATCALTTVVYLNWPRDNGSSDFQQLISDAKELATTTGWTFCYDKKSSCSCLKLSLVIFLSDGEAVVSRSVTVYKDLTWKVSVHGQQLDACSHPSLSNISTKLDAIDSLHELLVLVGKSNICIGNSDRFQKLFESKGPVLACKSLTIYKEEGCTIQDKINNQIYCQTARAKTCEFLIGNDKTKCSVCHKARILLRAADSRLNNTDSSLEFKAKRIRHDSRTPLAHLSSNELRERLHDSQKEKWKLKAKVRKLQEKIDKQVEKEGVVIDDALHEGLRRVIVEKFKFKFKFIHTHN